MGGAISQIALTFDRNPNRSSPGGSSSSDTMSSQQSPPATIPKGVKFLFGGTAG